VPYAQIELKTRILNGMADWDRIVPKALAICRDMGAQVNHTCGFHVHLDFPEAADKPMHIRSLVNLVQRYENVIYGLVSPSRRACGYCLPLESALCQQICTCRAASSFRRVLMGWNRRHGLNLSEVYSASPQIEYRYHQGTLNDEKARHWIVLCLQLMQHALSRNCKSLESLPNSRQSLEQMLICTGMKPNHGIYKTVGPQLRHTGRWVMERWKHFNGRIALRPAKKPCDHNKIVEGGSDGR